MLKWLFVACLALAVGYVQALPKPEFPTEFSVDFNETTKLIFSWQTEGTWYYDAEHNAELVQRKNGRGAPSLPRTCHDSTSS